MAGRYGGCALAIALVASVMFVAPPAAAKTRPPSEWVIGPRQKIAMIVFDGHGGRKKFRTVLRTLDRVNARASFFVSGRWVRENEETARRIVQRGHVLGNRGYGRTPFTEMNSKWLRSSLRRAARALRQVGARPRPFLRAPQGKRDRDVLRVAGDLGYRSVRWTHHPSGGRARAIQKAVLGRLRQGAIISLDMWRKSHRRAVEGIVSGLRERGFEPATIEALRGAHSVRWDVTLQVGSSGAEVAHLQRRLTQLGYPVRGVDGAFGERTQQGVFAFQKVRGRVRDGVVSPEEMSAIDVARRPTVRKRKVKRYIEIDISRQVLFEVRRRRVFKVLPVSTGNEKYYKQDGIKSKAHTPRGTFRIERKISGWRKSRLGRLWYPSYFVGGYAIHGSPNVPVYPASHGCVRIPMWLTKGFDRRNPIGTRVFIHE
jgi:peptidoglycan/xylan/chitin deacetylase (PgdA/CDA1 family)/peptidoglycan hydrolase-like protein with peptidoglycan-binding domain